MNTCTIRTNSGNEPLYPYAFIEQYGTSTKQFIDAIRTVSLGSQTEGPTFEKIIKQQGNIYGGMYPSLKDADGEETENPVSIAKEQSGETVHFLDVEIVQSKPGVSQIRMYDKRDHVATLAEYRRYPHVEPDCHRAVYKLHFIANFVGLQQDVRRSYISK